jgi:hypothetical protein
MGAMDTLPEAVMADRLHGLVQTPAWPGAERSQSRGRVAFSLPGLLRSPYASRYRVGDSRVAHLKTRRNAAGSLYPARRRT